MFKACQHQEPLFRLLVAYLLTFPYKMILLYNIKNEDKNISLLEMMGGESDPLFFHVHWMSFPLLPQLMATCKGYVAPLCGFGYVYTQNNSGVCLIQLRNNVVRFGKWLAKFTFSWAQRLVYNYSKILHKNRRSESNWKNTILTFLKAYNNTVLLLLLLLCWRWW